MIVCFVDIGGIDDHHCINFLYLHTICFHIFIFYLALGVLTNDFIYWTAWVPARLSKLQKGCTRLAAASDKVYQFLGHGRWFSPGTPASSTTKTGRHDIAELLLKVASKHQKSNLIKSFIGQEMPPQHLTDSNTVVLVVEAWVFWFVLPLYWYCFYFRIITFFEPL